ncbi:SH3 domain-containing protein [Vibrio sp. RC27]
MKGKVKFSNLEKTLSITSASSAIEQAMKPFESQQSLMDKALSITSASSAIEQAMKPFESQQSLMDKALGITSASSAIEQAMKPFESQQSLMDTALSITSASSAIEQAMKSFESQQSLMDKALSITSGSSAVAKAMKLFDTKSYLTEETMSVISGSSSVFNALAELEQASVIKQLTPDFLNCAASSISESSFTEYFPLDEETIELDFQSAANQLSDTSDSNNFVKTFKQLPPFIQIILAAFFLHIFLPQLNSISANLLTPAVTDYLSQSDKSARDKVKDIKVLPRRIADFDTTNLRFITGNNVRLRAEATTNSPILDEMIFGQVVTIHSKNKNWIEISYEYEGGTLLQGWVFTRYTERFVK